MVRKITSFRGEHMFLSNFYMHPVRFAGRHYQSAEHAYQAQKAQNIYDHEFIADAESPGKAKRNGRKIIRRPDWESVKLGIMARVLRAKFEDPELGRMLLDTGDAELVEGNTWHDFFWGICDGVGENWVGELLMAVRDTIREEQAQ